MKDGWRAILKSPRQHAQRLTYLPINLSDTSPRKVFPIFWLEAYEVLLAFLWVQVHRNKMEESENDEKEIQKRNEYPDAFQDSNSKRRERTNAPNPCHSLLRIVPAESPAPCRRTVDSRHRSVELVAVSWAVSASAEDLACRRHQGCRHPLRSPTTGFDGEALQVRRQAMRPSLPLPQVGCEGAAAPPGARL